MEMGNIMGGFMGMAGMNMGINPFVQLLNQSGLPPNWAAGLSGISSHEYAGEFQTNPLFFIRRNFSNCQAFFFLHFFICY